MFCQFFSIVAGDRAFASLAYNAVDGENIGGIAFEPSEAEAVRLCRVLGLELVDFSGFWVWARVVVMGTISVYLFEAVRRHVTGGFKGDVSDETVSLSPESGEGVGDIKGVALRAGAVLSLIGEVDAEEDCVVVGAGEVFSVFPTMEKFEFWNWHPAIRVEPVMSASRRLVELAEAFAEELPMGFVQASAWGQISVVIRECNEDRQVVALPLVHKTDGPLSGALETAADALATRNFDR